MRSGPLRHGRRIGPEPRRNAELSFRLLAELPGSKPGKIGLPISIRDKLRGGPSKPSSFVLRGAAEREDGPAFIKLGKTAQEPRAAT